MSVLTEKQIKHMVNRFLGWRLPEPWHPDGGVTFMPTFNDHLPQPSRHSPTGTNLFDAGQATDMVRYMIEGMPRTDITPDFLLRNQEYARLCGIAAAAEALAAVYPGRCTAPPTAKHPENCHCGQVILDRALCASRQSIHSEAEV